MTLALALSACGPTTHSMVGTERAAGADGTLTIENGEGNQLVTVELVHLPPPARVREGTSVYVVWLTPPGAQPTLAGVLAYDADDRTGTLRATTPHEQFGLIVTAEEAPDVVSPSDAVVARYAPE